MKQDWKGENRRLESWISKKVLFLSLEFLSALFLASIELCMKSPIIKMHPDTLTESFISLVIGYCLIRICYSDNSVISTNPVLSFFSYLNNSFGSIEFILRIISQLSGFMIAGFLLRSLSDMNLDDSQTQSKLVGYDFKELILDSLEVTILCLVFDRDKRKGGTSHLRFLMVWTQFIMNRIGFNKKPFNPLIKIATDMANVELFGLGLGKMVFQFFFVFLVNCFLKSLINVFK